MQHSAAKDIRYVKPANKKPWITQQILEQMAERKKKKNTSEYRSLNREIQRNCEKAHEKWIEERCAEIEKHSKLGRSKIMHDEIKKN